jgi:tetratricopeptide (TPR) repeat protein
VTAGPITASQRIFNLPFTRNRFFTGRDDVLGSLRKSFVEGEAVQALNGIGGIGKTQTALEYAYRHQQDYEVVLWGKANSHESLVSDFAAMANALNLPERDAQDQGEAVAATIRWFENHGGWLLILDNADDLMMAREFIPSNKSGHVLLTTRAQNVGDIAVQNAVRKMEPRDGALFLLRKTRKLKKDEPLESAPSELRNQAEALSKELDGLSLALDQAAAFIADTQSSTEEYLSLYGRERMKLLSHRGKLTQDHPSVTITFSLAFNKVAEADPAAADLLRVCAFLEADSIPEEIFSEGAGELGDSLEAIAETPLTLTETIGEAGRLSLLERNPETKTMSLHRLAQEVLRDEMGDDARRMWAQRAVRAVNAVFPDVEYARWPSCQQLIPHAQSLVAFIDEYGFEFQEAVRMMSQAGYYLQERAQYVEAEPLHKRALAIYEKALGAEHPHTATSLSNLAELYYSQGRYGKAEPLLKRSLAICEKALGADHPYTAASLNNLATLYDSQGRYEEAEPLYKRALAICEKALGAEHPDTATVLENYSGMTKGLR